MLDGLVKGIEMIPKVTFAIHFPLSLLLLFPYFNTIELILSNGLTISNTIGIVILMLTLSYLIFVSFKSLMKIEGGD